MKTVDSLNDIYADESEETFRDSLSTLDEKGKRKWIYPKKPVGKLYNWRIIVSYLLLAFLIGAPFVKIAGEPLLLLNIFDRKFVILGNVFWPQDFHLFVFGMITLFVFIILLTVVYGRVFCGWVCPQTIFMELVFRRIEYWIEGDYTAQKKLNASPWTNEKIWKKTLKQSIFVGIAVLIMHTFMSYLVGIERLWQIITSPPTENPGGFVAMIFFSGMFYLVFAHIREQVCTNICPYGRLQGVLLDRDSIVVAYDHVRGEKRSKFRKDEDRLSVGKGDCIDCKQCVYVCPTGIDIRNGTQLECVNCTACIDACDDIMDRVGLPQGLIRYASINNIDQAKPFRFTGRMKAYTAVLTLLVSVLIGLMLIRTDVETTILRTPGMMAQDRKDGSFSNLYNFKLVNKTSKDLPIEFRIMEGKASIQMVGDPILAKKQALSEGAFFILLHGDEIKSVKTKIKIGVYSGEELIETVKTNFLGPVK